MTQITGEYFCGCGGAYMRINVHQTEEPSPDVFDSNEAQAECRI